MRRRCVCRWLALTAFALAGCTTPEPRGQFGVYHYEHNKLLRLASGDTFTVYRVAYVKFKDGSPPAVQLEYAPPFPVSDTARLRMLAYRIWPAFEPYVRAGGARVAIFTATNLVWRGNRGAYLTNTHSFGHIAERDSVGTWRLQGDRFPLPVGETGPPRIAEWSGAPLPFADLARLARRMR